MLASSPDLSQQQLCCGGQEREPDAGLETNARPRRVKFRPGEWIFFFFFLGLLYYYYLKRDDKLVKFYDVMG